MRDRTFLIGLLLGLVAGIGFIARVVKKVIQGDGTEHYFTGFGVQFNYIGALVLLLAIPIFMVFALLVRRYQNRDERDFKNKYIK